MTTTLLGTQTFNTTSGTHTVVATPAVGDLIIIVRANTGNTTSHAPTDNNSDGLGTYSLVKNALKASSADLMEVWVRNSLIGSATSTTFTDAAGTTTGGGLAVLKITGVTTPGAGAIRQSQAQANQASGGTPTPVFSNAALTANTVIGALFNATSPATMTPRTSYTELVDVGYSTPTTGLEIMIRDTGETGTSIAWGNTSASAFCSIAIEVWNQHTPTVALNTPANGATGISTTPTLNFTGTDADGDAVEYEVEVLDGFALLLDGSQNYVLVKSGRIISGLTNWYVTARFKSTWSGFQEAAIYCERAASGNDIVKVELCGTNLGLGKIQLTYRDDAGTLNRILTTATYNDGAYHTVTVTKVGTAITIDVDGTSVGGTLTASNTFTDASVQSRIGGDLGDSGAYFPGTIDTVKVGASSGSLSGSWLFNEGVGTTTADDSGTGNTGTLSGSPVPSWVEGTVALDKISTADAGFTAGHPFASGTPIDFTVQAGNILTALTTYLWRVRSKDPSGSNTYGVWPTAQSFTTASGGTAYTKSLSETITMSEIYTKTTTKKLSETITLSEIFSKIATLFRSFIDTVTLTDILLGSFPTTSVLDDFNRADSSSLGSNWSGIGSVGNHQGIISNTLYNPDGAYLNYSDMYWNPSTFGPDCEVYMTIVTKAGAENNDDPSLYARLSNIGSTPNGYILQYLDNNTIKLIRVDAGVQTILGAAVAQTISSGDKIGMQIIGSTINVWYNTGSGWYLLFSRTDTTYSAAGYIGFYIGGNLATLNGRYDDFGGGTYSAGSAHSFTKLLTDTITFTDSIIRTTTKKFLETITYSEIYTKIATLLRSFTDTTTITDSATKQTGKKVSESYTLSDSFIKTTTKAFLETITYSEIYTKIATLFRSFSDTTTMTDSTTKQTGKNVTENVSLSEVYTRATTKPLSETVTFTDPIVKNTTKNLSESITLSEIYSKIATLIRSFMETVTMSDTTSKAIAKGTFAESITVTDSVTKQTGKNVSETITLSEVFTKIATLLRSFTEIINLSEIYTKVTTKPLSETVSLTDAIVKSLSRKFTEIATITDSSIKTTTKKFLDSSALSDITTFTGSNSLSLSELLTISDSIKRTVTKQLSETFSLQENFTKIATFTRAFIETVTLSETMTRATNAVRVFIDTVTTTDSVAKLINRRFTELITITDAFKHNLNDWLRKAKGAIPAWGKAVKGAGSIWTKIVKNSGIWTNQQKPD